MRKSSRQEPEDLETEVKRTLPTPILPSQAEIEEHRVDHLPPRNWCSDCVEGQGREWAHSSTHEARSVPVIGFDYLFLSRRGIFMRSEWQPLPGEDALKILVIRDSKSKALFAHAVSMKGVDEFRYVADYVVTDISCLGYRPCGAQE